MQIQINSNKIKEIVSVMLLKLIFKNIDDFSASYDIAMNSFYDSNRTEIVINDDIKDIFFKEFTIIKESAKRLNSKVENEIDCIIQQII